MKMDVDRRNFYHELVGIIEAISSCDALCIDLEMSGISTKVDEDRFNMNMVQVYAKAKEAAEAFTILQIGLTCASWDKEAHEYVTKTFNIPLAPSIVGDDLFSMELAGKIERQICFSSQTITFLQANNFDLTQVLMLGVPYLSVAETGQPVVTRWVKNKSSDYQDHINILELKKETQNFCRLIRAKIQDWVTAKMFGEERSDILNLTSPYDGRFSAFQKRLVRQIVETDFFEYQVCNKHGSMSMEVSRSNSKEDKKNGRIMSLRSQALTKLTGFRHVWDAITGKNFASKIDPEIIVGEGPERILALRKRLLASETRLHEKRPIIVGHNMLYDLCFLFKTFTGELPGTSKGFQELVRSKLPYIADTKYIFTRGHHEMMPDQSLEECFTTVRKLEAPSIRPASDEFGYKKAKPHQAGYDSFMTAVVFLKKAYQLSQTRQGLQLIPNEDPGVTAVNGVSSIDRFGRNGARVPSGPLEMRQRDRKNIIPKTDSLMDAENHSLARLAKFEPLKPIVAAVSTPKVPSEQDFQTSSSSEEEQGAAKIPEWNDGVFWKRYGNRVRVGQPGMLLYTGR